MNRFAHWTALASLAVAFTGCAADPTPSSTPVCGNDVCESGETHATCPQDCPAPPVDAGTPPPPMGSASLEVINESSWPTYSVYVWPCGSTDLGSDRLGNDTIPIGYMYDVTGLAPGCWNLGADNQGPTEVWESDENELGSGTWMWTLTNANATAAN